MKKLLLYTAGSGSREVLLAIKQINAVKKSWDVIGFVDEDIALVGKEVDGYPVYGTDHKEIANDVYGICCIMNPIIRQRITHELIEGKNLRLAQIISPSLELNGDFEAGPGSIVMPGVTTSFDVKLGKCVFVLWNSLLGHHLRVGNYSTILSSANITGGCTIGKRTVIGAGSTLNINISVGNDCLVGIGSTVLSNIGDKKSVVSFPRQINNDYKLC